MKKSDAVKRAERVKILLMDVDGVLTDGKIYFLPDDHNGKTVELKCFHALDGIGLRMLRRFGIITGVISGLESTGTEKRARMLRMKYVYMGFLSKLTPMEEILASAGFEPADAAYIGDDWTDIPVLRRVGLACAPKNALPEVKNIAHFVTTREGGNGAAREVCDFILKSQGKWKEVMELIESSRWEPLPGEEINVVKRSALQG